MSKILVTGSAGFIGFHLSLKLLKMGKEVVGIDNINNYYDPKLKNSRLKILKKYKIFTFYKIDIQDENKLKKVSLKGGRPQILAEATNSIGGTWADNGIIFFTIREGGVIYSISEKGGESKLVEFKSHLQAEGHSGALWPHALPGGRQLLVTSQNNPQKRYSIHLLDVETGLS